MFARRASLALLLLALIGGSAAHAYDHEGLARQALEDHVRPGYKQFEEAGSALAASVGGLCQSPSKEQLAKARDAFKAAALSYARVEHISFGPINSDRRRERMVFWPDPKGIMAKQVNAILEKGDETALDERLAQKSVAVQGLSALDIVMFGPSSDELEAASAKESIRCRYATAIANNVAKIGSSLVAGWAPGSESEKEWLQPGGTNTRYLTSKETTQALLLSYVSALETVRDTRLKGQLGMQKIGAKALVPMFPNSGLSIAFMRANIDGLRSLLTNGGFIARQSDPPEKDRAKQGLTALGAIDEELVLAEEAAAKADKMSKEPFADDKAREKLISMGFPLKNAYQTGGQTIADQAGITLGFSPNDGD